MGSNRVTGRWLMAASMVTFLSACGGGGSGGSNDAGNTPTAAPQAPEATLGLEPIKTFRFDWADVSGATSYKLLENPDGQSGFTQVGDDIAQGAETLALTVPLHARLNAQYILQACNSVGCTDSDTLSVSGTLVDAIGYLKASNTDTFDRFGSSLSLNDDGTVLAVGAPDEDSNATGTAVDAAGQANNDQNGAGAVYVFEKTGANWVQQAYLKADTSEFQQFGTAVSLSASGDTLAVGAMGNSGSTAGFAIVFQRSGDDWTQQDRLVPSNSSVSDLFGDALSLSSDGSRLAVLARGSSSNSVAVFERSGESWSEQALIDDASFDKDDVSLSGDGQTLAILDVGEAVHLFSRAGNDWNPQATVLEDKAPCCSLSLSDDGQTLAVGAHFDSSNAVGINGAEDNGLAPNAGAAYILTLQDGTWTQTAYLKASNAEEEDRFGRRLALSGDGQSVLVGAALSSFFGDDSSATGLNGNANDNSATDAGAAYLFVLDQGEWRQQAYIKASNTGAVDLFGEVLTINVDGTTLSVSAFREDSDATGIDGDQANNDAGGAGAVYLY